MNHALITAPLETKSADGDNLEAADVTQALTALEETIGARLTDLEAKSVANDNSTKILDRLAKIETRLSRPGSSIEVKSSANDNAEFERRAFTSYLRAGAENLEADERKSLTVGTNANGGFLVPALFGNELLKLLTQYSPVRSYARVVQIGGPSLIYPRRVINTGITPVAVTETGTRTASQPTFEQITLTAFEMATYVDVSNQVLEDNAYNLEGELMSEFAEFFGKLEGSNFVNGDGTTQAKGIMTSTDIPSLYSENPSINSNDVVSLFHSIPTFHAQNAVWMMNRSTLSTIRKLTDGQGRFLLLDPISNAAPSTLLGRPVVEMIDMPSIGPGAHVIMFGDLQGYRIVDRVALQIQRDPFSQNLNGLTRFIGRKRVGGGVTHYDRFMKLRMISAAEKTAGVLAGTIVAGA